MKILVAMSGGVDSSVTAHLLAQQGHELIGIQMELWTDPLAPAIAAILPRKCCNPQTRYRAEKVASDLGIPFHRISFEAEFKRRIVDRYLQEHREGKTPNPCITCNREIKFGLLLEHVKHLGCGMLATGHYARVAEEELPDRTKRTLLLEAVDKSKDQSYFLYALDQEQLRRVIFPLGTMMKKDVYALAKKFNVPLPEHYRESQDLCFFPEREPDDFLDRYLGDSMRAGPIVDREGKKLGTHRGLPHYTIGQRQGLRIGGLKIPLEVVEKDMETNTLVVSRREDNQTMELSASNVSFIAGPPPGSDPYPCEVRTCYQGERKEARVKVCGATMTVRFIEPQRRTAPGQSVVCYRGEEVLGGGVVCSC